MWRTHAALHAPCLCLVAFLASCGSTEYQIEITVLGGEVGTVEISSPPLSCSDRCSVRLRAGESLELRANPGAEGEFIGWGGDCSGVESCRFTITKDSAISATFRAKTYSLHLEVDGAAGAIQLADGSRCSGSCDVAVVASSRVRLTAVPREESYLVSWQGPCTGTSSLCEFGAAPGLSVTAEFGRKVLLEIKDIAAGTRGIVTSTPRLLACGDVCEGCQNICSVWLMPGTKIGLNASTTDTLWGFHGWTGIDCTDPSCEIVVDRDISIEASFSNRHAWSRSFSYLTSPLNDVIPTKDGGLDLALSGSRGEDFGSGFVSAHVFNSPNLFLTRYSPGGAPEYTDVFISGLELLESAPDGGSAFVGLVGGTAGSTVNFGSQQFTIPSDGKARVRAVVGQSGAVNSVNEIDDTLRVLDVVRSGSTLFATIVPDQIGALRDDWTPSWILRNPYESINMFPGPAGSMWVTTSGVQPEMNCTGGPIASGALLKIDATGTCTVVWTYPETFGVTAARGPGGAPFLDGAYSKPFEFAGQQLPTPPAGVGYRVRLRFDENGDPRWSKMTVAGGGTSGQVISDIVKLGTGQLLTTGFYLGISELSPDVPASKAMNYLALYSDETGELQWVHTFEYANEATSFASFDRLVPLAGNRVALLGEIKGTFDFGGGPLWAPTSGSANGFLAVYDF